MEVKSCFSISGPGQWWLVVIVVLCLCSCVRVVQGQAGDSIKVRVLKGAKELSIKGSDRGSLEIKRAGHGRVTVNGREKGLPMRLKSSDDRIYLNGKPFRGALEVIDAKDGLMVVNDIAIEAYLVGIINNEISSRWADDVIKTQAVVARTYALHQKMLRSKAAFHLEGTVMGQVYTGSEAEDVSSMKAVTETAGEILSYGGGPALTVYHSNAGGVTEASINIWKRDYPYLVSVKSPYDESAPRFQWEFQLPGASFGALLVSAGYPIAEPESVEIGDTTGSGRVRDVLVADASGRSVTIAGEDLRRIIGYSTLRSTIFEVKKESGVFVFSGRGSGHGVGLSQWGAKGMADNGYSYKEILKHYYPGTDLVKAY